MISSTNTSRTRNKYLKAIDKNNCLIDDLERARDEFCGIG